MEDLNHQSVLYFMLRVILGILFFFQGYDKVFRLRISGVIDFFREESKGRIPGFLLVVSAYLTSWIELVCGGLLILGLFQTSALYLLTLDMVLVCGAFSILKPMWDMQLVLPRLLMLAGLLYLPEDWNILSLDQLLSR